MWTPCSGGSTSSIPRRSRRWPTPGASIPTGRSSSARQPAKWSRTPRAKRLRRYGGSMQDTGYESSFRPFNSRLGYAARLLRLVRASRHRDIKDGSGRVCHGHDPKAGLAALQRRGVVHGVARPVLLLRLREEDRLVHEEQANVPDDRQVPSGKAGDRHSAFLPAAPCSATSSTRRIGTSAAGNCTPTTTTTCT